MVDLRVILDAVEPSYLVADGCGGAGVGVRGQGEALRHLGHVVPVAHPGDALRREAPEQLTVRIEEGLRLAVFPGRVRLGRRDSAPQRVGHELTAIADPQHRHAQVEDLRIAERRILSIDAARSAGEDESDGIHAFEFLQRRGVGLYLAVHPALPDPPGDQLVILTAEIQNDNHLVLHALSPAFAARPAETVPFFCYHT